jgi:hypothetical protein
MELQSRPLFSLRYGVQGTRFFSLETDASMALEDSQRSLKLSLADSSSSLPLSIKGSRDSLLSPAYPSSLHLSSSPVHCSTPSFVAVRRRSPWSSPECAVRRRSSPEPRIRRGQSSPCFSPPGRTPSNSPRRTHEPKVEDDPIILCIL